jgi:hypothetical protein
MQRQKLRCHGESDVEKERTTEDGRRRGRRNRTQEIVEEEDEYGGISPSYP